MFTELSLKDSELRYRRLFEAAQDGILILDARTGMIEDVNPYLIKMLGYSREEFIKKKLWEVGAFKDVEASQNAFEALQDKEYIRYEDLPLRTKGGTLIQVEFVSNVYLVDGGKVIQCNIRDITEHRRIIVALQANEKKYYDLVNQSPDGIFIIEASGNILTVNKAMCRELGFSVEEFISMNIWDIIPHEYLDQYRTRLMKMLEGESLDEEAEYAVRAKDGKMHYVEVLSTPHYSGADIVGFQGIARDITARKHDEETIRRYANELEQRVKERTVELNHTNAELELANHAKDEFLANMSHELRTPLNSILGLSESLLEGQRGSLTESQRKSMQIIAASGGHLLELISDILDLAKLDAGKYDYYPQGVRVDEVCKSSLSFVQSQAARKSITLAYSNETSVPEITADPRRLKQILVNLLNNAVKFTPDNGKVTLEVRADAQQELIQISVVDSGIGIAPADLKRLFTPFVQVDSSLTREFEGTGLGLAIAQKLTDLHGGSIQVESEVGSGSRFTVRLRGKQGVGVMEQFEKIRTDVAPVVAVRAEGIEIQAKKSAARHKILLAEDNEANVVILAEYLENHEYEILVAGNGLQAIEMAQENNPQVILMDIQMPLMNGLEAMRRLRAQPRFASTPIIALTALAMVGDRERCIEAGATEYMSKPVSLNALRQMIETLIAGIE